MTTEVNSSFCRWAIRGRQAIKNLTRQASLLDCFVTLCYSTVLLSCVRYCRWFLNCHVLHLHVLFRIACHVYNDMVDLPELD